MPKLYTQQRMCRFPELVTTKVDGYKAVQYGNLVAPIIEAIKELHQNLIIKTQAQDQEIALLQQEIKLLKKQFTSIKQP